MRYDEALTKLGELGPYQLVIASLVTIISVPVVWYPSQEVFNNPIINHWCSVPEIRDQCEEWGLDEAACDEKVIAVGIPPAEPGANTLAGNSHCRRYDLTGVQVTINTTTDDFNHTIINCNAGWDFDRSVYMSTIKGEFELVCDQTLLSDLPQTIFSAAGVIGVIIFGALGDKFGRKPIFTLVLVIQGAFGLACVFAPSFAVYFVFRTVVGLVTTSVFYCGFVLIMEIIGTTKRNVARLWLMCLSAVGVAALAGFHYFLRWWRAFSLIVSLVGIVFIFFLPFIPESPAWQLTVGKIDQAEMTMRKMARINKRELPDELFTEEDVEELKGIEQAGVMDIFRSRILRFRQLIISWMSFCVALTVAGLTLNSGNIGTDPHLSFVLLVVVELPGYLVVYLLMDRIGRKWTMFGSFLVSGAGCIATAFVEPGSVAQTALAMTGKFGVAGALSVSDLYVAELLPTQVRNAGSGLNGMGFGIGTTLAPYISRMQIYWAPATMLIYGVLTLSAGIPVLVFLPETMGRPIPVTIEDGENFGKKPKDKNNKPGTKDYQDKYKAYDDIVESGMDMVSVGVQSKKAPSDGGEINYASECIEETKTPL